VIALKAIMKLKYPAKEWLTSPELGATETVEHFVAQEPITFAPKVQWSLAQIGNLLSTSTKTQHRHNLAALPLR